LAVAAVLIIDFFFSGGPSSPTSDIFETASQGTFNNSFSLDSHTLLQGSPLPSGEEADEATLRDETLSRAASSASFMSAVSELEDFDVVDLHCMMSNKPITESPLLMSSYIAHLTQLRCSYWRDTMPVLAHEPQLHGRIRPEYHVLDEGFNVVRMACKSKSSSERTKEKKESVVPGSASSEFEWDTLPEFSPKDRGEFISSLDCNTSKATVIVNFDGAIDVTCCPIMLQSLEAMLKSLEGTFQRLHPVDVVNHLHSRSVDRVESMNTLKKEKSLDLQEKLVVEPRDPKTAKSKEKDMLPPEMFRTFEKSISSYVQASVKLPKINVMVLQASVVEDICTFSALDRVRDITCVSLLSLGIQGTTFQFSKTSQSKKTVQIYLQQKSFFGKKKKSKYKIAPDSRSTEPFAFESSETQREEILINGATEKVHAQLRRLKNDSSILQDAAITAIPQHRSKVFFEYANVPQTGVDRTSTPTPVETAETAKTADLRLGYNMCECGFEGIRLKVAKRSCNQDDVDEHSEVQGDRHRVEDEVNEDAGSADVRSLGGSSQVSAASVPSVGNADDTQGHQQGKHSTAYGSVELSTTWFNFAAPPKTPISKRIDFTKLDWNLLSTATPSIDAWLAPADHLQEAWSLCMSSYHSRVGATMASLMADALDVASDNFLKLTKYDKLTALSKTLRDDPSCQLCSILLKYMMRGSMTDVEANLDVKGVPPLTTLRQGIVVLSRQWKNALYTPILIEYNLRCRNLKNIYSTQMNLAPVSEEAGGESDDDQKLDEEEGEDEEDDDARFDEAALLLKGSAAGGAPRVVKNGSIVSDISASIRAKLSPAHFSPLSDEMVLMEKVSGRNKRASFGSDDGSDARMQSVVPSEILASGEASPMPREHEESLYNWMRRQQYLKSETGLENVTITIQDQDLKEESVKASTVIAPQTKSMHLLDAHIIFEPLLSSLGLMPQQIQNLSLKSLGYNMSAVGTVDQFRIDIIESEGSSGGKKTKATASMDANPSPSFICEKIYLQVDLKKVTDIGGSDVAAGKERMAPLYMTKTQLKRHTSTMVNFNIDVEFISQKVNMPLLRLLNQIATMHQNVKETNEELREQRPEYKRKEYMRHKKNSSGSSTSSNISAQLRQHNESMTSETGITQTQTLVAVRADPQPAAGPSGRRSQQSPSPSVPVRSQMRRPKSFAQKFRPNSRLAGYSNLDSPIQEQHDSFILTSAPLEMITEEQTLVRCWKTMYNLLELYSTMPTTKTVQRQSLTPVSNAGNAEAGILVRPQSRRAVTPSTTAKIENETKAPESTTVTITAEPVKATTPGELPKRVKEVSFAKADIIRQEHTPIIVFGVVRIAKTRLTATLSGLKLKGEISGLQTSVHYRERIRTPLKGVVEVSVMSNVKKTTLVLSEGLPPHQQAEVVKVTIGKAHAIHTSHMMKSKDKNSGTFAVDLIHVEIPQHPVDLHSIVTRGTKELSSTLQEFRGARILQRGKTFAAAQADDLDSTVSHSPRVPKKNLPSADTTKSDKSEDAEKSTLIKPFVMQFHVVVHKLLTSAALLPSLKAEYCMEEVTSRGVTVSFELLNSYFICTLFTTGKQSKVRHRFTETHAQLQRQHPARRRLGGQLALRGFH